MGCSGWGWGPGLGAGVWVWVGVPGERGLCSLVGGPMGGCYVQRGGGERELCSSYFGKERDYVQFFEGFSGSGGWKGKLWLPSIWTHTLLNNQSPFQAKAFLHLLLVLSRE